MTDFVKFILMLFAGLMVRLVAIVLLPWSVIIAIQQKNFGQWCYEVARGWDILGNKLYAPVFNAEMGDDFGKDETISQRMAKNKRTNKDTKTAKVVEKIINVFDKNHLDKVL